MSRNRWSIALALCLLLPLCACGGVSPAQEETVPPAPPPPAASVSPYDVPGEETSAGAASSGDGLEGAYYNDFLRQTLTLDGSGGALLRSEDGVLSGSYRSSGEGTLRLTFGEESIGAAVDGDGDVTLDDRRGYFLRDWALWGITAAEAGTAEGGASAADAVTDNGDGTYRYRDFENGVALTCPDGMTVLPDKLVGGLAVWDGGEGYVTARNVTGIYATHGGTDAEFLRDYTKNFVFADFALLYGGLASFDSFLPEQEDIEGRLASVTLSLQSADDASPVQAKAVVYTSTYADGTENYICKTVFLRSDAPEALSALERAVTGVGAVRLVRP